MQIILVQTEVEQALRNYVASRLTLAEGTTFSIDLAATRGANGITATIDLVEPGQKPVAAAAPVQQVIKAPIAKPETTTKAPEAQQAAQVAQSATAAQEQAIAGADVASAAAATEKSDVFDNTNTTIGGQAKADEAQASTAGDAAAPTKSLFGNLARPKN